MYVPVYTPHSAALHVGLKSFALSGHLLRIAFPYISHINPALTPHSTALHVGLKSFALSGHLPHIDPTFRYAACGAEIFCPFRASAP
ncbi:hypothetical protein Barb4_04044 [Bacteroidales bacterium Barb4]|nr:hypothetical protein Barb4_04044 [Bacteroidales bacterium Barb4]